MWKLHRKLCWLNRSIADRSCECQWSCQLQLHQQVLFGAGHYFLAREIPLIDMHSAFGHNRRSWDNRFTFNIFFVPCRAFYIVHCWINCVTLRVWAIFFWGAEANINLILRSSVKFGLESSLIEPKLWWDIICPWIRGRNWLADERKNSRSISYNEMVPQNKLSTFTYFIQIKGKFYDDHWDKNVYYKLVYIAYTN